MLGALSMGFRGMAGPMPGTASKYAAMAGATAAKVWGSHLGKQTTIGAGAGAAWGAVSNDTSVLGGAAMGAGLGRYGGAAAKYSGLRSAWNAAGGMYASGAGIGKIASRLGSGLNYAATRGAWGQMKSDFAGATLLANQGKARISAMFK